MANDYDEILEEQAQPQAKTAAPATIYDQVVDDSAVAQERQLRGTMAQATELTPDRAAENQRLSTLTGIPAAIVHREFDAISKRVQIDGKPYEQIMRESPALTTWLTDKPENAAVAQDDLENLGALEWLITAPQRAFAQGVNQLEVARLRTKSMTQILTQDEQDMLNAAKYHMNLGGKNGVGESWFRGAVAGLSGQLPILFGAGAAGAERSAYTIPAAFAFGMGASALGVVSAPVSVPVMFGAGLTAGMISGGADFAFEVEAGLAYDEFLGFRDELDQPIAPEAAKVAAITAGALNAGLEVVGLGILAKTIPGVDKLTGLASRGAVKAALRSPTVRSALFEAGKTYTGALAAETAVEVAQRGITLMSGELGKYASGQEIEHITAGEFGADLAHEAASALQTFALMAAPGPTLGVAVDVRRAKQASQNEGFFQSLAAGVTQSKTFERQPAAAQDFIARVTKDGPIENVYAPIEAWTTYWQSQGLDPADVATEITGNPRAYVEAKATGVDLQIPTAAYAVKLAGTEHNKPLSQELRLQPDAMNARESKEFIAEMEAAAAEAQPATAEDQVRAAVVQKLQVALAGSGISLPASAVERYADVYQAIVGTLAERENVDVAELFERYGLEVLGPNEQGPGAQPSRDQGPKPTAPQAPSVDDLDQAVAVASGVPASQRVAVPRDPNIAPDVDVETGMTDEAGRPIGGYSPTGVERRKVQTDLQGAIDRRRDQPLGLQPNFSRSDVAAAAAMMRAENPDIEAQAQAMRDKAAAAGRTPAPKRDGTAATPEGGPAAAPVTEDVAAVQPDVQVQAAAMLDQAFPPGSAEREELVNLRKTADPNDFKEFLQNVFAPPRPEERPGLHAVGDSDGPQAFAWGIYAASLRELGERYAKFAGTTPGLQPTDDVMLDWDRRASEQPPAVQQALRAIGVRWSRRDDPMGSDIYRSLSRATDVDETGAAEASRVLMQHGVLGTLYRDAGVPNYVAFDKSLGPTELWQSERPKGFDTIAQHLTPQEANKLRRDSAERLVEIFKSLPPDQDFSEAALAGIAKRGWYRESALAILRIFGDVDGPRFAALLAALSPQTSVESNLYNTVSTWKNWTAAGRPTDRAGILKVMARSVQGTKGEASVLESWVPNAVRALSTADPKGVMLSGPKVQSFYRNLIGEVNEVTNDAWMASFSLIDKTVLGGSINAAGTDPGKGPGYLAMIAKIRRVAKKLTVQTGELWTPDEVQETIWSWAKTLYELADSTGTDAETIVREGQLSDAAIASTPDFNTLFTTDPTVRSLLEAAGYGDAISALESELGRSTDRDTERPGGGEGRAATEAGAVNRPATLGTLRSARRLDKLRRERAEASRLKAGTELSQELRPAFYSRILETIKQSQTTKASGAQWKATVKNSKLGVSADEYALTHVDDLEDGKSYTRDEVLQYLRTHEVKVGQVVLGAPPDERGKPQQDTADLERRIEERAQEIYDDMVDKDREQAEENYDSDLHFTTYEDEIVEEDPDNPDQDIERTVWRVEVRDGYRRNSHLVERRDDLAFETEEEAEEWLDSNDGQEWKYEHYDRDRDNYFENYQSDVSWADAEREAREELEGEDGSPNLETHYDSYVVKGFAEGGTYREAFIVAEDRPPAASDEDALRIARVNYGYKADEMDAVTRQIIKLDEQLNDPGDHITSAAMLAMRAERDRLAGDKEALRKERDAISVEIDRLKVIVNQEWVDGHSSYAHIESPIVRLRFNVRNGYSLEELEVYQAQAPASSPVSLETAERSLERINAPKRRIMFLDEVQPPQPANFKLMPALFQKNWREIAFKWALRYAAEHNLDAVAWTTGAQQQDRYSLRKQVSKIEWTTPDTTQDQGTSITGWAKAGGYVDPGDQVRAIVVNTTDGRDIKLIVNYKTGDVVHAVGAASQWAGEPLSSVMGSELADQILKGDTGTIEGEGLEIGGVGLARLYDVDFRNVVNALPAVKKNKGKVGRFSIGIPLGGMRVVPDIRDVSMSIGAGVGVVQRQPNGYVRPLRPFQNREAAERWLRETAPTEGEPAETRYIIERPTEEAGFEPVPQMEGPNHSVISEGGRWFLRQWHVQDAANVSQRVFQSRAAAEQYLDEINVTRRELEPKLLQQGIELTEQIKAAVMGGQVLFQSARDRKAGATEVAKFEAMATDEAMGVEFPEHAESHFPDGSAAVVCTNCAERIIAMIGRGEVWGWEEGTNPTSVVAGPENGAQVDEGQGHDFAIIDDRYLVDPWAKNVESSSKRAAFDLENPKDRKEVLRLYGDPSTWLRRTDDGFVSDTPGPLRAAVIETPAFKRWFGDSEVTDEKDRPAVMYHGTSRNFTAFKKAYGFAGHFGTKNAANTRLQHMAEDADMGVGEDERRGHQVLPVYLSIQNAVRMSDVHFDEYGTMVDDLIERGVVTEDELPIEYEDRFSSLTRGDTVKAVADLIKLLQSKGFDGIVYQNNIEDDGSDSWIAFEPNQIKSAVGNTGAFDPSRSSILEQPQRGKISFGPDRQFTIQLFADADVSTFMHESAHLFLEMLQDLGAEQNASDQLLGDLTILREQLWNIEPDAPIGVEQHEQFARAFEAYLMTGAAPSVGLRGVFNQFRAWLMGLYRTLAELDVTLTDDVRGVFDRMMASDRLIADAAAEFKVTPMFTTPEAAGMSSEEFGRYQETVADASRKARETLEAKLLQEVRRAQKTAWRAQADDTREEVTKDVHQQPVYQALAAMRRGTRPDGSPIVDGVDSQPLRLSRDIIVERYGEDRLRQLPRPYIYSNMGGLDPDVVAQMYGFSSGDALLREVTGAPAMNQAIETEVQRLMRERYGDQQLEQRVPEAAKAALANDNRDEIIRAELRALGQLRRTVAPFEKAGDQNLAAEQRERAYERRWMEAETKLRIAMAEGRKQIEIDELSNEVMNLRRKMRGGAATVRAGIPSDATLREAARTRIGRTKVRDIRPATFWSAAKRASTRATELAATGDFDGAITAKQEELINMALYRAASQAQEQAEKRVRQALNLSTPSARARLGRAGEDYLDQIDGILDRYDFARASQKVLDRRQALRMWVSQLEAQGLPVDLPDGLLEDSRRIHYRELPFDELLEVTDGLTQIAHLARLKLTLLQKRKSADLQATVDTLVSSIRANARRAQVKTLETRLPADQALRMVDAFFAGHRKMASLAREFDGFEDGGAMWESVILPLNEAADREAVMNAAATKALGKLVNDAFPGREKAKLYQREMLPAIGDSLTKMGRLMVALNWGNEGNRQRVMSGYGWNEQQVQSILDTLDQRDWQFVQGVWDFIDSYWEEIAAKQERVTGLAPEKVEGVAVKTKFGEMKGGYFPIKYDDRLSARAGSLQELEASQLQKQAAYVQASTRRGHTKERMAKVTLPVRLDFGVLFEHVNQVIHDLSHHEALIDIGRVMGHKEVQAAIYETYGDVVYKQFRGGLKDVAVGLPASTEAHEKVFNHLRVGSTIAGLGWNLTTAFLQPLGLTQSMVRIGPTWVGRGVARWIRDAASLENTVAWIANKSDFMKLRGQTQQREINEIRNQVGINTGKVTGWVEEILRTVTLDQVSQTGIADSYFFLIQQMQRVADVPTWIGQYEKSMAAGETEERAIQLADQAVIDAQGGGQTKDLAAVQRGPAAWKLWTNFYSFFSTTYQLTAESTRRTKFNQPGAIGRLAVDYVLLYIVPATLGYMLREAMKGNEPDEEEFLQELVTQNIAYAMGTVMGLRELSGAVQGYYGYEGPAGARGFSAAAKLVKQVSQGEADAAFWRALNDTAGILFHYPSGQVRRTIEGIVAIAEGRTKNPGVLVSGAPAE